MRRVLTVLLLAACATRGTENPVMKQRGVSFAAAHPARGTYGTPASADSLRELKTLGADWISIMPFAFHRGSAGLTWGGDHIWETDESLSAVTRQAHDLGIKVLLKPHIWGRSELHMQDWTAAEWRTWFDDYGRFADHYAALARDIHADAYCIGNEQKLASSHEGEWRAIIRRVRAVYRGPLTYGANFDEVFDVPFWDALDWIGVSGYFPLSDAPTPSRAELIAAWQPILTRLEQLSKRSRRPIVFTEIGYRSADRAAGRQWEIPRDAPANPEAQRIAYEAFFETVWPKPWVAGAYPWKWFSYPDHGSAGGNDYDFEHKPAADVIRRAYGQTRRN